VATPTLTGPDVEQYLQLDALWRLVSLGIRTETVEALLPDISFDEIEVAARMGGDARARLVSPVTFSQRSSQPTRRARRVACSPTLGRTC
jgi:hypothetical protein